jgi:hypothetical protein
MSFLLNYLTKYLRAALVNYKTTLVGVGMILHALLVLADQATAVANGTGEIDPAQLLLVKAELLGGVGFISTRDGDKTSEQSGVKH